MSTFVRALRFALSRQANAYGFTLIVWGTGAIAVGRFGRPDAADAFAFVGGALTAAVLAVLLAFGISSVLRASEPRHRAYSAMHVPSVPAAIAGGWGILLLLGGAAGYFAAAFVAVLVYESLLSAEIGLATIPRRRRLEPGTTPPGGRDRRTPAPQSARIGRARKFGSSGDDPS